MIISGPYKQFIINDDLVAGFKLISQNRPDAAFTQWKRRADAGDHTAQYNVGVMLHQGIGTRADYSAALDYLFSACDSDSHYNSADSYSIRVLQDALYQMGYLATRPDGSYGPKTDAAVDAALADLDHDGSNSGSDFWYYWAIVEEYQEHFTDSRSNDFAASEQVDHHTTEPANDDYQPLRTTELFEKCSKSVYLIVSDQSGGQTYPESYSQGSAVAIFDDLLVTNCHVVENSRRILATQNGNTIIVKRARYFDRPESDICFLEEKNQSDAFNSIEYFRETSDLKIGEPVFAIGSPKGEENSLSEGLVSGIRKYQGVTYIQTTAPISSGSSGGALFDADANLVGITTMSRKDAQSMNFAISIDEYIKVFD
ncbi:MAG: trypsin-like serine protease [Shimia sp.]|nr:trypsin-like serine protease [Shimia sp.]